MDITALTTLWIKLRGSWFKGHTNSEASAGQSAEMLNEGVVAIPAERVPKSRLLLTGSWHIGTTFTSFLGNRFTVSAQGNCNILHTPLEHTRPA